MYVHKDKQYNIMLPGLQKLTMLAQITPSYIIANIFHSECFILFL